MSLSLGEFYTVKLPANKTAPRALSYPPQDPNAIRTLVLDCCPFLEACNLTITGAYIDADTTLQVDNLAFGNHWVSAQVSGGYAGTSPVLAYILYLSNGNRENVNASVPIQSLSPPIPASYNLIASPFTFNGSQITFSGQTATWNAPQILLADTYDTTPLTFNGVPVHFGQVSYLTFLTWNGFPLTFNSNPVTWAVP